MAPNASRDGETAAYLDRMASAAAPRLFRGPGRPISLLRQLRLKSCDPLPDPLASPTNFLGKSARSNLDDGGSGLIEGGGIDYILPYWMARYYGVVND